MPLDRSDAGRDEYVPGTSRKRVRQAGTDRIITRAESENNFAQRHGFRSNYEMKKYSRKIGKSKRYENDLRRARSRGIDAAELRAKAAAVSHQYDSGTLDKSPTGPLADYLNMLGYGGRNFDAGYAVGESPGVL
jgi:hypothetical protein